MGLVRGGAPNYPDPGDIYATDPATGLPWAPGTGPRGGGSGSVPVEPIDPTTWDPLGLSMGVPENLWNKDLARQILAEINPYTGAYDPGLADLHPDLISNARIAWGYDAPGGGPGPAGGGPSATPVGSLDTAGLDAAAARNQTPTLAQLQQASGYTFRPEWEDWHTGGNPSGQYNYASEATARQLAELLGGTAALDPGVSGGPFPRDPWWQVWLNEEPLHAGRLAQRLQGLQTPYQQALDSYQRSLSSNPSIIGTGNLTAPVNPVKTLLQRLTREHTNAVQSAATMGIPYQGFASSVYPNGPPGGWNVPPVGGGAGIPGQYPSGWEPGMGLPPGMSQEQWEWATSPARIAVEGPWNWRSDWRTPPVDTDPAVPPGGWGVPPVGPISSAPPPSSPRTGGPTSGRGGGAARPGVGGSAGFGQSLMPAAGGGGGGDSSQALQIIMALMQSLQGGGKSPGTSGAGGMGFPMVGSENPVQSLFSL